MFLLYLSKVSYLLSLLLSAKLARLIEMASDLFDFLCRASGGLSKMVLVFSLLLARKRYEWGRGETLL